MFERTFSPLCHGGRLERRNARAPLRHRSCVAYIPQESGKMLLPRRTGIRKQEEAGSEYGKTHRKFITKLHIVRYIPLAINRNTAVYPGETGHCTENMTDGTVAYFS